jgi:RimJ/RimL family protein N-acetyltransferase
MQELKTKVPDLELLTPDVERDAPVAVKWLEGDVGRTTLKLMGNTDAENKPSSIEEERARVQGFLDSKNTLNWTISFRGKPVGAVWVDLEPTEYLEAPAVHIMIGDPDTRGHGVGQNSLQTVTDYLRQTGYHDVYSRHLIANEAAAHSLARIGFENHGKNYSDENGLNWQNMHMNLR